MKIQFKHHHVAISVMDLNKSINFYKKLGFIEWKTWDSVKGGLRISHLKLGSAILELFCFDHASSSPKSSRSLTTDLPRIGTKHFALQVESVDDARSFVIEQGIVEDVSITRGVNGLSYFFISDPDGILFEIIQDDREA